MVLPEVKGNQKVSQKFRKHCKPMQLREIRLKMAAVLKKNAPNSNNKNFFGGRNYFLFFRLEKSLSLSLFPHTLSFNRHAERSNQKVAPRFFSLKQAKNCAKTPFLYQKNITANQCYQTRKTTFNSSGHIAFIWL